MSQISPGLSKHLLQARYVDQVLNSLQHKAWNVGLHGLFPSPIHNGFASWCGERKALFAANKIHYPIIRNGFDRSTSFGLLLARLYSNCGDLEEFSNVHERSLSFWNSIIRTYARKEQSQKVFRIFHHMQREAVIPDEVTFVHIISACANRANLSEGKRMHARIQGAGLDGNVVIGTALVNMYGKCGNLEDAHKKFQDMPERNVVTWTSIIAVFVHKGQAKKSIQLFNQMQLEGLKPNRVTFICILDAYTGQATLTCGKQMHACIAHSEFESDITVGNALINMYSRCGSPDHAQMVFVYMTERNLVSWNAMITVHVEHVQIKEAFQFFDQMRQEGLMPNNVTFLCILDACARASLFKGKQMHTLMLEGGFSSDIMVGTALVNMYGRCGSLDDVEKIFKNLLDRDVVLWTSIIAAYGQHGQVRKAMQLFNQMRQDGIEPNKITFVCIIDACASSAAIAEGRHMHVLTLTKGFETDIIVRNALISMYGKCGVLDDARNMFNKMHVRTVVSWTAMIALYAQHGHANVALMLFEKMQQNGIQPNEVTYESIIDVCASQAPLDIGKRIHACIVDCGFESYDVLASALINMYGKWGCVEDARKMFDRMPTRSVDLWAAMIATHAAQYEEGKQVLQLLDQMQKEDAKPNEVTFTHAIDTCATCSVLSEGTYIHSNVIYCGFEQDVIVGTALVNMYGKCGDLESARRTFDRMSDRNVVSWTAMISVYAQHGQGMDALSLFEQMQDNGLMPSQVTLVSILDACSRAGLMKEGLHCLACMIQYHGSLLDVDHYVCMVDLFGRAGCLDDSEHLMNNMPLQPTIVSFMAMVGACRYHGDLERAEQAVKCVLEFDPENIAAYIMLSNMYASTDYREDDAPNVFVMARNCTASRLLHN